MTHYCVANVPALVPRTSTLALTNATPPYVQELAGKGVKDAISRDGPLLRGVNTHDGMLTNQAVADSQGRPSRLLEIAS